MQTTSSQSDQQFIAVLDETLCDGCKMCLPACSYEALLWVRSDEMLLIDPWACNGCGKCITTCPKGALELHPRRGR